MAPYIYNDEDNAPMCFDDAALYHDTSRFKSEEEELMADPWVGVHNPTNYYSRSEMEAAERGERAEESEEIPFSDPPECCGTCDNYNGSFCTKEWNNLDECYKVTWRDSKDPEDWCEDYTLTPYLEDCDLEDIDMDEVARRKEKQ